MTLAKPPFPRLNHAHPLAQGLVGSWLFYEGGGGTVYDLSGGGNNGALTNMDPGTDWVGGSEGWALDFDGSDDHVLIANSTRLQTASVTVSMVFVPATITQASFAVLVRKSLNGPATDGWALGYASTSPLPRWLVFTTSGLRNIDGTTTLAAGSRWHVIATYSSRTGVTSLYVNGKREATASHSGTIVADTDPIGIGGNQAGGTGGKYLGKIGGVQVWNRSLSEEEIQAVFHDPYAAFRERQMIFRPHRPRWLVNGGLVNNGLIGRGIARSA